MNSAEGCVKVQGSVKRTQLITKLSLSSVVASLRCVLLFLLLTTAESALSRDDQNLIKLLEPVNAYKLERAFRAHVEGFSDQMGSYYCEEIVLGPYEQKQKIKEVLTHFLDYLEGTDGETMMVRVLRDYGAFIRHQTLGSCKQMREGECDVAMILGKIRDHSFQHLQNWLFQKKIEAEGGILRKYRAVMMSAFLAIELLYFDTPGPGTSALMAVTTIATLALIWTDPLAEKWKLRYSLKKIKMRRFSGENKSENDNPIHHQPLNPLQVTEHRQSLGLAPYFKGAEPSPHIWMKPLLKIVMKSYFPADQKRETEELAKMTARLKNVFNSLKNKKLASQYVRSAYYEFSTADDDYDRLRGSIFRLLSPQSDPSAQILTEIKELDQPSNAAH